MHILDINDVLKALKQTEWVDPLRNLLWSYRISQLGVDPQLALLTSELAEREDQIEEQLGFRVPLGIVGVVGPGGSGKTTWMRENIPQANLFTVGETGSLSPFSIYYNLYDIGDDLFMGIDSWKDLWGDDYLNTGAAMPGGITGSLTTALSLLNQCLHLCGVSIIININPLTMEERESIATTINSTCAGMILLSTNPSPGSVAYAQGRFVDRSVPYVSYNGAIRLERRPINTNGGSYNVQSTQHATDALAAVLNRSVL